MQGWNRNGKERRKGVPELEQLPWQAIRERSGAGTQGDPSSLSGHMEVCLKCSDCRIYVSV